MEAAAPAGLGRHSWGALPMTECYSFRLDTPDGRRWSIEVHGPGRIKAVHIDSPTGYSEWITEQQAGITWLSRRAGGENVRPDKTKWPRAQEEARARDPRPSEEIIREDRDDAWSRREDT